MEQLEAWLKENNIEIAGQVMTGSGDLLRYLLRLPNGSEIDFVISAEILVERPNLAIEQLRERIEAHEGPLQQRKTNGHS